jgi:GT2 family glycosyltransferase
MPDLRIIIVSWNCRDVLRECLHSIERSETKCGVEIVVVDNNSTDGTLNMLRESYPNVAVMHNVENRGFAAANNQALRAVNTPYVLLLNPDTVVHRGALDAMVEYLNAHDDVWAVGPAMKNGDGSPQRIGVSFPKNWNIFVEAIFLDRVFPYSKLFGAHKRLYYDPTKPHTVDFVQGASLMVKRRVLDVVGLLDERFFMYFEEADWCYRIARAGGVVRTIPFGAVVHLGAGELGHFDATRLVYYHESLLRFYRKHYSKRSEVGLRVLLVWRSLLRVVIWLAVWLAKPAQRSKAGSAANGYWNVLRSLFR